MTGLLEVAIKRRIHVVRIELVGIGKLLTVIVRDWVSLRDVSRVHLLLHRTRRRIWHLLKNKKKKVRTKSERKEYLPQ